VLTILQPMKALFGKNLLLSLLLAVAGLSLTVSLAKAESAAALQISARHALQHLYKAESGAAALGRRAAGILVFPEIIKGGFIVGAQYGNGVLFKGDKVAGYYNTTSGSFGYQAGVQKFGYALFFMTPDDLKYLDSSAGWEVGTAPNITIWDKGVAASISSTTLQKGMYAFFFDQKGLMAGLSLQGTKITRIHPD
jgi:lipid-binding SYLF domain-containing protein